MSRVLVIDPAGTTGYAIADVDGDEAKIIEYDFLEIDTSSEYMGDWCIDMMNRVEQLIEDKSIDSVAVEDYFFGGKFATGSSVNTHYRAAVHMGTRKAGLEYEILNVSEWKKHVAGRARPTPAHKKKWSKEAAKKVYIQEALWHKYGFRFPNHSISKKTGKPVQFKYDIVDAVGMTVFYLEKYLGVKRILMDIEIPEDVEFNKLPKAYFNYTED